METLEIVKTCGVEIPKSDGHKQRVQEFLGTGPDRWEKENADTLNRFKGAGFHLFVSKEEVFSKFKYHAGINGGYQVSNLGKARFWLPGAIGVGVPVVGSIAAAIILLNWWCLLGLFVAVPGSAFASLFEIPIMTDIDYVGDIPEFALENVKKYEKVSPLAFNRFTVHSMSPLPTEEHMVKVDPVLVGWPTDEIGVVIAIWDGEKEIEVF